MTIIYDENVINVSRETLIEKLQDQLSKKRFDHVLRVEETAVEMAEQMGVSTMDASIAALLHDYCKEMPNEEMYNLAKKYTPFLDRYISNPNIWHSYAAAYLARHEFGINSVDIIDAIAVHTIGWGYMGPLSQIIFIADFIEPGRDFEGVDEARKLAKENLEEAVLFKLKHNIMNLVEKEALIYIPSIEIYNEWLIEKRG